ncbi:hypothetical protein JCM8097_000348 [Rhodosporidiobolus ruineniae]
MSFSPRPRPQTVNLSFTDPDVTDTYRDERSSVALSSPRQRHPRGDTPLSRRQASEADYSSPGRWTVSSRRSASERGGGEDDEGLLRHERSNLDKLLDLLDDDDGAVEESQGQHYDQPSGRSFATSTPPPPSSSSRPPPPPSTTRRAPPPSSARPYSPASHASPSTTRASDSPSIRAPHRSLSSSYTARPNSALSRFQRTHASSGGAHPSASSGGGGGGRVGAPDSPSPRPGSVAALRRNGGGEGSFGSAAAFERSGVSGLSSNREGDEKGQEQRYEGAGGEDGQPQEEEEGTEGGGSLDSVARVAQAAMDEFDTIISHGVASSSRSASRLRNIPSPERTPSPHIDQQAEPRPTPPAQYRPASSSQHPAEDGNAQLVQELREAQDYIDYLQDELRAISDIALQLKEEKHEREQKRERRQPNGFAGDSTASIADETPLPHGRAEERRMEPEEEQVVLEETSEAAFEVVKYLVALLPSLSLAPSPSSATSPPSPSPSLSSLALTLSFTRQLDQLAHASPHARRDEDVFRRENLEGVLRRVRGWERVARVGEGDAGR